MKFAKLIAHWGWWYSIPPRELHEHMIINLVEALDICLSQGCSLSKFLQNVIVDFLVSDTVGFSHV